MAINFDWGKKIREFEWRKNWKWVALGVGVLIVVILVIVLAVMLSSSNFKAYQKAALGHHNAMRKEHQAGPLELDGDLNSKAVKCAEYYVAKYTIDHTCPHKGGAGENLFATTAGKKEMSAMAEQASRRWYSEVENYNFEEPGLSSGVTGHFTAMMWKASKKLGIGAYKSDKFSVVVALYSPPPNMGGRFRENVLPKQ